MFKNIIKIGIDCCGCGNCFYICKKDAITLKTDDEGFIHPFVNYNCVDCGACLNVCPQTKEVQTIDNQQAYIVLTKDANIKKCLCLRSILRRRGCKAYYHSRLF